RSGCGRAGPAVPRRRRRAPPSPLGWVPDRAGERGTVAGAARPSPRPAALSPGRRALDHRAPLTMTTRYVAILRAINLGAHNRISMKDLQRLFADLGHDDVSTYVQSGNVVFSASS